MGSGIAQVVAQAGFDVTIVEVDEAAIDARARADRARASAEVERERISRGAPRGADLGVDEPRGGCGATPTT